MTYQITLKSGATVDLRDASEISMRARNRLRASLGLTGDAATKGLGALDASAFQARYTEEAFVITVVGWTCTPLAGAPLEWGGVLPTPSADDRALDFLSASDATGIEPHVNNLLGLIFPSFEPDPTPGSPTISSEG